MKTKKPGYYTTHPEKSKELQLLRIAKGQDNLLATTAKDQLIIRNEGFLRSTIQKWIGSESFVDFEYLLQESRIEFFNAIQNYDLKHDVSIRSYASFFLKDLQRRTFKKNKFVELKDEHIRDFVLPPNIDFKDFDLKKELLSAIKKSLTVIEQEVILLHFFQGCRKREIAFQRHCSEARICNIVKAALPKLKTYLTKIGIVPSFLDLN